MGVTMETSEMEKWTLEEFDDFFEALQLLKEVSLTENGVVIGVMVSPDLYNDLKEGMWWKLKNFYH